jgi:DNA invertase Pin-like site-specific DNA recombinase
MAVYTYRRVSTNKQETSLEDQEAKLIDYCKRHGFEDVIHLFDSNVSGGISLLKRPQGERLNDLKHGDWVIFHKHDRAVRSTEDGIRLVKKWYYRGVNIVFMNISEQPINISNPTAKFSFFVLLCSAEYEKDMTGQRTTDGLIKRRLNGQTNSKAKFGFNNVYYDVNGKKEGKEEPNEYEQETLLLMNKYRKTMSGGDVAEKLNLQKRYNKSGKEWKASNIDTALYRANNMHVFEKHGVKYWRDVR